MFIFVAELINAALLFNLSKYLGRGFVKKTLRGDLLILDDKIDRFGFWSIFALRIIPLVPYRFLDVACGMTKISFGKYFLAVVLGSPLRIFWIQLILSAVGENVFKKPEIIMNYFYAHQGVLLFSFLYALASIVLAAFIKKYFLRSKKSNQ